MKNKLPEDSVFRKKSFFVALYSCVGVVLILAAVISYININQVKPKADKQENISGEMNAALANKTSPNPALSSPSVDDALARAQSEAAKQAAQSQQSAADSIAKAKPSATAAAPAPIQTTAPKIAATAAPAPSASIEPEKAAKKDKTLAEPAFNCFKDGDTMNWPVKGDIVLDYSTTQLLYDQTLDQYRTNDSIWISASPGSPVKAASDGVVQKIEKTQQDGTTILIDDGNGWTTTYGQLLDSVLVKEGDVVKRGQIIGGIANPTKYGVLQGPHLSFKIAKDDVTVDPKTILATEDTQPVSAGK